MKEETCKFVDDAEVLKELLRNTAHFDERKEIRIKLRNLRRKKRAENQHYLSRKVETSEKCIFCDNLLSLRKNENIFEDKKQPSIANKYYKDLQNHMSITKTAQSIECFSCKFTDSSSLDHICVTTNKFNIEKKESVENISNKKLMAPLPVEEICDESLLEKMLDETTVFEERKKIRAQLREIRRKRREEREERLLRREKEREIDKRERLAKVNRKRAEVVGLRVVKDENENTLSCQMEASSISVKINDKTELPPHESIQIDVHKTTFEKFNISNVKESNSKEVINEPIKTDELSTLPIKNNKKLSAFEEELMARRKARDDKRVIEEKKWKEEALKRQKEIAERRKLDSQQMKSKKNAIIEKFGGKNSPGSRGSPKMVVTNANTIKQVLLQWCQNVTTGYEGVNLTNFSSSWSNGLAFCAIIHHFYPDAFNFDELNPKNRRYNFDLAFRVAQEKADIAPLLDTDDMIMMKDKPDWKCVFCYVQSLYRKLKDKEI